MTTNREKLAKMTNEGLATFFANLSKRCPNCKYYDAYETVYKHILDIINKAKDE